MGYLTFVQRVFCVYNNAIAGQVPKEDKAQSPILYSPKHPEGWVRYLG